MNAIAQASAAPETGPKLDNRRVLAALVDLLLVAAGALLVLLAGDALAGNAGDVQGALAAVILGWALYYYFALESGDGQTVGKRLMKLRVVRADGSPAGMREVAVRTILRVIDNYLVGLIVMLATGDRRQRIGDLAAGTIIVDASAQRAAAAAAVAPAADLEGPGDDSAEADEPVSALATITLPARPAPPATVADLAPDAPEREDEPAVEVEEEPVVEVEVEPAVAEQELPPMTSPSLEELARDVAAAQAEPAEPAAEEVVTVRSVETVSAIDLIMGGAAEDEGSDEPEQDAEGPASQ